MRELREAGVTHLRYPGGRLSDYFDWRKAVGTTGQSQPYLFYQGNRTNWSSGRRSSWRCAGNGNIPGHATLNAGNETPEYGGGVGEGRPGASR